MKTAKYLLLAFLFIFSINVQAQHYANVVSFSVANAVTNNGIKTVNLQSGQSNGVTYSVQISAPPIDNATGKPFAFNLEAYLVVLVSGQSSPITVPISIAFSQNDFTSSSGLFLTKTVTTTISGLAAYQGQTLALYFNDHQPDNSIKAIQDPIYQISIIGTSTGNPSGGVVDPDPTSGKAPLYRMFFTGGQHFYTTSASEANMLLSKNKPQGFWDAVLHGVNNNYWRLEGVMGHVYTTQVGGTVALNRYFNKSDGNHMYTTSASEGVSLINNFGYVFEGPIGYVNASGVTGTTPVYRYTAGDSRGHFFTTTFSELGGGSQGYTYEGNPFNIQP